MRHNTHPIHLLFRTVTMSFLLTSGLMTLTAFSFPSAKAGAFPNITPGAITRVKGAMAKRSTIATVSDAETPAGDLTVVVLFPSSFISVTNLVNDNGSISADVAVTCAPSPGIYSVFLRVRDGEGLARHGALRVNVTEAALSYSSPAPVSFNSARVVAPDAPPEGFASLTVAAPDFKGDIGLDQATGAVAISHAKPAGSFMITVTATNLCGGIITRSFTLIVANGNTEYQGAVGEPIPPSAPAQGSKGSILVFNLYSSSFASPATEDTRIAISNRNATLSVALHLFFVANYGSTADTFICVPADSSKTLLVSQFDPGSRGYLIAIAVDAATGSPMSFNYLTGREDIWLASGHNATGVKADSFQALFPEGTSLPFAAYSATINLDGISYSQAARTLALDDVPNPAEGNETILVFNGVGGNLATGPHAIGNFRGVLYNKTAPESLNPFAANALPQFFSALSDSFPLTAPSFSQLLGGGKDWRMVFHAANELGLSGLMLNRGLKKQDGRLLRPLTLTRAASLTVPVFPSFCQ